MSWLTKLFSGGVSGIVDGVASAADRFITTPDEKRAFELELEKVVTARLAVLESTATAELQAKERVITAELQQGDNYTKRARPTLVYFGMLVVFANYCVAPLLTTFVGIELPSMDLPTEFWVAWGGTVSAWSIGRSFERVGIKSKTTSILTGSQ